MDFIDSDASRVVQRALDGLSTRHSVLSGNLANADTPGYKAMEVSFEDSLKEALEDEKSPPEKLRADRPRATDKRHFIGPNRLAGESAVAEARIERSKFFYSQDKNGVDLEQQMALLARNTGRYQSLAKMESKMFNSLRNVIKGGGG